MTDKKTYAEMVEIFRDMTGDRHAEPTTYATKTDAITYDIEPALGDFADDFDTDAIFDRCFDYATELGCFYFAIDPDDFWDVAEECDISAERQPQRVAR